MQRVVEEMTRTREDLISSFENLPFTNKNNQKPNKVRTRLLENLDYDLPEAIKAH